MDIVFNIISVILLMIVSLIITKNLNNRISKILVLVWVLLTVVSYYIDFFAYNYNKVNIIALLIVYLMLFNLTTDYLELYKNNKSDNIIYRRKLHFLISSYLKKSKEELLIDKIRYSKNSFCKDTREKCVVIHNKLVYLSNIKNKKEFNKNYKNLFKRFTRTPYFKVKRMKYLSNVDFDKNEKVKVIKPYDKLVNRINYIKNDNNYEYKVLSDYYKGNLLVNKEFKWKTSKIIILILAAIPFVIEPQALITTFNFSGFISLLILIIALSINYFIEEILLDISIEKDIYLDLEKN